MATEWPRRAEFVNLVLAWGVGSVNLKIEEVEFDGVAGAKFDLVVDSMNRDDLECNDIIGMALKLEVPVEGLVADGTLGEKWAEVVDLCKAEDVTSNTKPVARQRGWK